MSPTAASHELLCLRNKHWAAQNQDFKTPAHPPNLVVNSRSKALTCKSVLYEYEANISQIQC